MTLEHPSHDERLLDLLRSVDTITMEQVAEKLSDLSWGELFLAVDRLSRCGKLVIQRRGFDYELSIGAPTAVLEPDRLAIHQDH